MPESTNTQPATGSAAPDFTLPTASGDAFQLSKAKGKPVVVYFYPKDDTPGCTVEAKGFEAMRDAFEDAGAIVVGISPDGTASHCKFAEKYGLGFVLASDEDHRTAQAYGVWVEKSMYGKKYWGVQRATFLIDGAGRVAKAWPKVKPEGHAEEVLEAVKAL